MQLLVIFGVHEVIIVAVGVQKLHLHFVNHDLLDRVAGTEPVLKHSSGAQVPQFSLDECAKVAGGAVFHTEYRMQVVIVLNDHAGTQLGGWNRHASNAPYLWIPIGRAADSEMPQL